MRKIMNLTISFVVLSLLLFVSSTFVAAAPTLKHLGNWDRFDPNAESVAKFLEAATGYKVEYHMLPVENANEVLSLRISTPGAYDSLKLNPGQYSMLSAQGALMPLDDLLKQYGPRILEVISEESWNAARVNGKIYGVPEKNASESVGVNLLIRLDILEELGLRVPTTVEEFYEVAKAIRIKKNMLPLAMADYEVWNEVIGSAFGLATNWTEIDGKLLSRVENPGMKSYLEFMHKMYNENLIDQDFPINNRQQTLQKFTSGQAAMIRFAWWEAPSVINALLSNVPDAKLAYVQPLIGKNGEQGIQISRGMGWFIAIPQGSKNAVDVVKWWNAKLEHDTFKELSVGKENVHFYIEAEKYFPILPIFEVERDAAHWYLTGLDEERYPIYWQARVRKNPLVAQAFDEINKASIVAKAEPIAYAPALPITSRYIQSLNVLVQDAMINFIAGGEDLNRFDSFVQNWGRSGGTATTEEVNQWYNENK